MANRPSLKSKKTVTITNAKVQGFLAQMAKQKFLELQSPPISGGEICASPTIFQFESLNDGQYHDFVMSVCSLSIEGVTMVKAFYELAEITEDDEWSLVDYFSETWKRPEYQDLLAVD